MRKSQLAIKQGQLWKARGDGRSLTLAALKMQEGL